MRAYEEIILFFIVLLALIGFVYLQAEYKAKTFNKFSKTKVTVWEALISDLRVTPDN